MKDSLLLALFALRHYGYPHLPADWWGDVFAACGSVCIIALVMMLKPWLPLAIWIVGEELLVAGCSLAWLYAPFDMAGQSEQCSAMTGLQIGAFGLAALACVTYRHTLSVFTGTPKAQRAAK